jgi:RND family efflux transporter MFP subunit
VIKRIIAAVFILAVIAAGALFISHKRRTIANLSTPDSPPIPVATATVKEGSVADTIQTVAMVQSDRTSTASAQVTGAILEVRGREGDRVQKGQLLARIDARVLQDGVEAARARLAAADEDFIKQQAIFDRDRSLFESHDIPQQNFDVSKAQLEASRATRVVGRQAYESAITSRSYAEVTAPYAGVITARMAEAGDLATPGKPLFTLQTTGHVRLLSKLSQDMVARVKSGSSVTFSVPGQTLNATVTRIYPALDLTRLGIVETELDAPPFGLPAGATLSASYSASPASGLVVPVSALLQGIRETLLVRVRNGVTEAVAVKVTGRSETNATVQGSVSAGDTVITGLPSELMALSSGSRVTPSERR